METSQIDAIDARLDARPDTPDFRDQLFIPTLVRVKPHILPDDYIKRYNPLILDQGREGACTGYGLAAVCHFLLGVQSDTPRSEHISPKMLYEMAKLYDEWEGEAYNGSSTRGALKGWHKHGVCTESLWTSKAREGRLTPKRADDAVKRPLGAYYRVDHTSLVAMHSALNEVGILYAAAIVHEGWNNVDPNGVIPWHTQITGGHAFAIIGYDAKGFWVQNSWGDTWGYRGFGRISYSDWLRNGCDVWVARNGVPVVLEQGYSDGSHALTRSTTSYNSLRPHVILLGNDGYLHDKGTFKTTKADVSDIFNVHFPTMTRTWKKKRLVIYVHGGLTEEKDAIDRLEDYVHQTIDKEVYFLGVIWRTDLVTTLRNILNDAIRQRKSEGALDQAKEFLQSRIDDALEPLARFLGGKMLWEEMKENAARSTTLKTGGCRLLADHIAAYSKDNNLDVHLIGFSAGSILLAHFCEYLAKIAIPVKTCTFWAPACTTELFKAAVLPSIENKSIKQFCTFNLSEQSELNDSLYGIYNKSLLYLVSHAFEKEPRIPLTNKNGTPILGMEKYIRSDDELVDCFSAAQNDCVISPNQKDKGDPSASTSISHGGFDDDDFTVQATIARILRA